MSDYAKKKNDELAALCKERGLPHTGKKAELVKRLEDHDSTAGAPAEAEQQTAEESKEQEEPKEAPPAAETSTGTAPKTDTSNEGAAAVASGDEANKSQDFSLGLSERTLDEEIEKRKKRAAKFGIDISKDETLKQLERAKKFGTTELPGLLNTALPERGEKQKKRGREGKEDQDNRKRSRQRGPEDNKNSEKPAKPVKEQKDGAGSSWMTASDREAADKRRARFKKPESDNAAT